MGTIIVTNAHGTFTTNGFVLDAVIEHYLPASPEELRAKLQELTGFHENQYDDVYAVSELLVMLAECYTEVVLPIADARELAEE